MSQNTALLESTHETAEIPKIDLSRYRTGALVSQLTELVSAPEALRKAVRTSCVFAMMSLFACLIIFFHAELSTVGWMMVCGYCVAVGLALGAFLGGLRVIATALKNIESILREVLQITGSAAADCRQMRTGQLRMPSAGELVEHVYDDVLTPALEQAVSGVFSLPGKALCWIVQRSIGSAIRFLIQSVNRWQMTVQRQQEIERQAASGLSAIAGGAEAIHAATSRAMEVVGDTASRIRFYAMFPLYTVFFVSLSLAALPIFVMWHLALL